MRRVATDQRRTRCSAAARRRGRRALLEVQEYRTLPAVER